MRKSNVVILLAFTFLSAAIPAAFARSVTVTRELTAGQFLANCNAQGGTMSYGMLGAKCKLPNGTSITCSFIGHLASCTYETSLAPIDLNKILNDKIVTR